MGVGDAGGPGGYHSFNPTGKSGAASKAPKALAPKAVRAALGGQPAQGPRLSGSPFAQANPFAAGQRAQAQQTARAQRGPYGKLPLDRPNIPQRSEVHTAELQPPDHPLCRLLLEKKQPRELIPTST